MSEAVRIECYCPTRKGHKFDPEALCVTFATATPLVVWFSYGRPCAFKYGNNQKVVWAGTDRRHEREIDFSDAAPAVGIGRFDFELKQLVKRLFEPPGLSVDTPPGVVADWLQDLGLGLAAHKVREAEAEEKGDGSRYRPMGRMVQCSEMIEELRNLMEKFGNTCLYVKDLSWGAVALNRQAADQERAPKAPQPEEVQ